jgi:hypothetical protein
MESCQPIKTLKDKKKNIVGACYIVVHEEIKQIGLGVILRV